METNQIHPSSVQQYSPLVQVEENHENLSSAAFLCQIEASNSSGVGTEHLNRDFPLILATHFKPIISELVDLIRPVPKKKLRTWIAPYLKRKAGITSLNPDELKAFHENFNEIPDSIKEPILEKYRILAANTATAASTKRTVSIDCKARIFHIMSDPGLIGKISDAYCGDGWLQQVRHQLDG